MVKANVPAWNSNTQFAILAVLAIMLGVFSVRALSTTLIIPAAIEAEVVQEAEKEQVFYSSGHPAIWLGSPNNNQ